MTSAKGGAFPKLDPATKRFFESILPAQPDVDIRPMFGHAAAFVHGNMFAGIFGPEVFVRLGPADQQTLMKEVKTSPFEPMPGRPMREYMVIPAKWRADPARARSWAERSYLWAAKLPPKTKAKPAAKSKKAALRP
ncbi:MAG: TfoX/Sxy family protein [Thermoplasmata archaeon]|nr:TfoX/Sxy family protein [Thermoplasmata archaeon]